MYIKKYFDGYVSKMRENYKVEGKAGKNWSSLAKN